MDGLKNDNHTVRILVVEDDEEMRSLLKDFLEEEGFETDSASNGSDAFRKLFKEPFDLVITDIRMPGLTGLDILPRIRKLQPEALVIVITAFGNDEVYRRSFEKGAAGYFGKPIRINKLRTLIREMVSIKAKMVRP
jgi:DNA-binding response OmpR family regulator